jgi:hypothetical protein
LRLTPKSSVSSEAPWRVGTKLDMSFTNVGMFAREVARPISIHDTSITSLNLGARLANERDKRRSSAMSSRITAATPGRWIFTTAGRPPASTTP